MAPNIAHIAYVASSSSIGVLQQARRREARPSREQRVFPAPSLQYLIVYIVGTIFSIILGCYCRLRASGHNANPKLDFSFSPLRQLLPFAVPSGGFHDEP